MSERVHGQYAGQYFLVYFGQTIMGIIHSEIKPPLRALPTVLVHQVEWCIQIPLPCLHRGHLLPTQYVSPTLVFYLLYILSSSSSKGQLISKGLFGVFKSTKKPTVFLRISALTSKRVRIKKIKALHISVISP